MKYIPYIAVAAASLLAASANATPASFGFVPIGPAIVSTGDLISSPATITYTSALVNIGSAELGINFLDPVTLSGPFYIGDGPIDLTVSVASWDFWFNTASLVVLQPGSLAMSYTGPSAVMSQSCDQAASGGPVNCSNTTIRRVIEPSALASLGAALFGMGLLWRKPRRVSNRSVAS